MASAETPLLPKAPLGKPFAADPVASWPLLLNPVAWLLWILDFCAWLVSIVLPMQTISWQYIRSGLDSCPAPSSGDPESAPAEPACRRQGLDQWADGLHSALDDDGEPSATGTLATAWSLFDRAATIFGPKACFGTREFLGVHRDGNLTKKIFGPSHWLSYAEVAGNVRLFGAGLRSLGLAPLPRDVGLEEATQQGAHTILIFEETCADWATALFGAFSQSIAVATSYATLGIDAVVDSASETQAAAIVCNYKDVGKLAKASEKCPSVKSIIYTLNCVEPEKHHEAPPGADAFNGRVIAMEEVIRLGSGNDECREATPPTPDTVAVVMYTSGSTGKPKGVVLAHRNLAATVAGLADRRIITHSDVYVAYLPAAHILELCAETLLLGVGATICFADPRSITSKGACRRTPSGELNHKPSLEYAPGAIQEFRPTILAGVPLIWDTMKKSAEEQIGGHSAAVRFLFQVAYSAQYAAVKSGRTCPLLNALVFRRLQAMAGGRLRIALTGGGPIAGDTQNFIRVAMGCQLVQGYALTETCAGGTVQHAEDFADGVTGPPLSCVEVKLRSVTGQDEPLDRTGAPYLAGDTAHCGQACRGRGEVCIRGPCVSPGYFRQPEQTREAFSPDGWFRSGDIGIWDTKGRLVIVDRIKNLVKLKGGEYIALENMEKEYQASPYVHGLNGGVLCYGDGDLTRPVAFVQANVAELTKWANGNGIPYLSSEDLCGNPKAEAMVLKDLQASACARLSANEKVVAVKLVPGTGPPDQATPASPWTPENGFRTASNKINRKAILATFKADLERMKQTGGG